MEKTSVNTSPSFAVSGTWNKNTLSVRMIEPRHATHYEVLFTVLIYLRRLLHGHYAQLMNHVSRCVDYASFTLQDEILHTRKWSFQANTKTCIARCGMADIVNKFRRF